LKKKRYIVARFSSLTAHHDRNIKGISDALWSKISDLIFPEYQIVLSIENDKSHQIVPSDMHHILNYAKLVISDSQTMSAESAVLGVPSIRCNSFVGRIFYLEELEHQYHLTYGFLPEQEKEILRKIKDILTTANLEQKFSYYRSNMLNDKINLTQWMINLFEKAINPLCQ
jgi:predicted glycosyltransferase